MTATSEEREVLEPILKSFRTPVIVELGACRGEDYEWITQACKPSRYVMAEADSQNFAKLVRFDKDFTVIYNAAITDRVGHADFHVNHNHLRMCGSLRQPTLHLTRFPHIGFGYTTTINTLTLDYIFDLEELKMIDLLWVDIQGSEREMILGGEEALKHTRYVFIEMDDEEFYAGAALRPELMEMLSSRGFEVVRSFGQNVLLEKVT